MLPERSVHLKNGSSEKFLYCHSGEIRESSEVQSMIRPALAELLKSGFEELRRYSSGYPELRAFKKAFVLLKTSALLDPEFTRQCHHDLRNEFGSLTRDLPVLRLFLPSVFAWGADSKKVSDADRQYIEVWPLDSKDPNWGYASAHIAAYYGPARLGAELLGLTPDEMQRQISMYREKLRRSLIIETHRNCSVTRNDAWTLSSFAKMHVALPRVGGYRELPRWFAVKVVEVIKSASAAAYRTPDLPESKRLHRIMNDRRAKLQKEHNILDKELWTIRQ